jgi:hypothetical protein
LIELPTGDARRVAVTALAFAAAWLVARSGTRTGRWVVNFQDRRLQRDDSTTVIAGLKRRESALSLIQTTVRYIAYLAAATLGAVRRRRERPQLRGPRRAACSTSAARGS